MQCDVAVIGGGPAGLMAAEVLSAAGVAVHVFDAMPSVGRKFLMAGKGGMNITHSEPFDAFLARYGARREELAPMLGAFGPEALREWMRGLGVESFVGSSGRVFPKEMKAAPLLRAWLHRLRELGVRISQGSPQVASLEIEASGTKRPLDSASVTGGSIGGLLRFQNEDLPEARSQLGMLAAVLADTINTQHAQGTDLDGRTGGDLLSVGEATVRPSDRNARDAFGQPHGKELIEGGAKLSRINRFAQEGTDILAGAMLNAFVDVIGAHHHRDRLCRDPGMGA